MRYDLSDAQRRALLHLYVGPQYNKRTGKRWYPSKNTYDGLMRKGLVTTQGGSVVLSAEGASEARAQIPF